MPQFDTATFLPQLFWLAVIFSVLMFVMRRHALPRISSILEARQMRITSDLEKAGELKADADRVLEEYEKAQAETRAEASALLKKASDEAAAEGAKRLQAFVTETTAKTKAAEARIATAKQEARGSLESVAAEAARAATAKLIGVEPKADQLENAVQAAMQGRR